MTGFLVRAVVRNVKGIDYRAIGAAGYLGLGTVWALGMSSSPALLMATPASIPPALIEDLRRDPIESDDIFLAQPGDRGNPHRHIDRHRLPVDADSLDQDGGVLQCPR